jgi:regulator of RNase E activity RraA
VRLLTEFSVTVTLFVNNKIKVILIHGCVREHLTLQYLKDGVFGIKVKIQYKAGTKVDMQLKI